MSPGSRIGGLLFALSGLLALTAPSPGTVEAAALERTSVAQAIRYLGVLAGQDLAPGDAAWLEAQWAEDHETSPETVPAEIDELAFAFERHRRDGDALTLAHARTNVVKNAYCAAEQSGDPATRRLSAILAPEELVLAADCVLGQVLTRFDVDGLVASHALIAAAAGQPHDAESDRAEILATTDQSFAAATPAEKALLANGELRHAVLARFWSRIDGTPEQAALLREIDKGAAAGLRAPARQLEGLALSKLREVDHLAKAGEARLTASHVGTYLEWLGRIAGYGFSSRDRDWLQQAIIGEFEQDPGKVLNEIAGIERLNRDYTLAGDAGQQSGLIAGWAAHLHCHLAASVDPEDARLAEMIFRADPVIDADCAAGTVRRQRQSVLAEAGEAVLRVQDLELSRRFTAMILGRPLLPEEEAVIRADSIALFERDPAAWREEDQQTRALLANVEKHDQSRFIGMDERKTMFDRAYCALKASDGAFADDYVAMFQRGDQILFEDCAQPLVTTEAEIQAVVRFVDFLALLNGRAPLDPAQVDEIRETFKSRNLNDAESSMLALQEWWSLLSLEEKVAEAENARAQGITPEADAQTILGYVQRVKLDVVVRNAKLNSCRMAAIINQGQTAIYGASMGPGMHMENNPSGVPGERLAGLMSSSTLLGEVCKDVFGG